MTVTIKRPKPVRAKPAVQLAGAAAGGHRIALHLFDFTAIFHAAPIERIEWIKHGVAAGDVLKMAARLDTSQEQLMQRLGLPRATIIRKSKAKQHLSTEQAERVVGLAKLIGQVQTMVEQSGEPEGFDAAHWIAQWIERPIPALGGRRPAELMDTVAGQELVASALAKMQSGAYA